VDDHLEKLWDRRGELEAIEAVAREEGFQYTLRGGKWTQANMGVAYDCYMASAKPGLPTDFCSKYGMCRSASFAIRKYTEDACLVMVRAWMHRMSYFYRLWVENGCTAVYKFAGSDIEAYKCEEPAQLAELEGNCVVSVRCRIEQLRRLAPRLMY
jgi:hypothetical protein